MVRDRVATVGVTLRESIDDSDVQSQINAVTGEFERDTLRDFLPSNELRYFDGSGIGYIEVDEFIQLGGPNWKTSTAYAVGNIVSGIAPANLSNLGGPPLQFVCTVAGTSAASGTGPVGTGNITDGTVTWNPSPQAVTIIGYIGTSGLIMPSVVPFISANRPNYRIEIARGSLPSMGRIWFDSFPRGRGNIAINAVWGYGDTNPNGPGRIASIPVEAWEAVRCKIALRLIAMSAYVPTGRIKSGKEKDASRDLDIRLPGEACGWDTMYLNAVDSYRRGSFRRIKTIRAGMI
jgi:hypothetical protein